MFQVSVAYYANTVNPFIPELWSRETLALLTENMIATNLVHRDFENEVATYGQTVNTRRPKDLRAIRKTKTDTVTVQDTDADSVQVKLDQHLHTSFQIYDLERALTMDDLIELYMGPAAIALARASDKVILGQYPQFINANQFSGKLNGITTANIKDMILDNRQVLDESKCPESGRNQILSPKTEADVLRPEWFTSADKVGDRGTALREASIGQKLGFDFYKSLNMANVLPQPTIVTGAINNSSGYPVGATALTVDGFTGLVGVNSWLTINGLPYRVHSQAATSGDTTTITIRNGLKKAVADNDAVVVFTPGQVNNASGYATGWDKPIIYDTFTVTPKVGQMVTFAVTSGSPVYTIIEVDSVNLTITLDRALEETLADNAKINIGPDGAFNLAFHKNAITFVNRPLPLAKAGALSSVSNYRGISLRSTITYNGSTQAHLVTLDMLCGVKVLDTDLGSVLLG